MESRKHTHIGLCCECVLYAEVSYMVRMPSKNKPNAFMVYAQSIRQQLIREGHVINGMPDLVAAAGPYWKVFHFSDNITTTLIST